MLKLMILKLVLGAVVGGNYAPVAEPLNIGYQVTNDFWSCNLYCYHLGTDMVAPADTEVHSVCAGTVKEVTYRAESATGKNYGGRMLVECEGTYYDTVTVLYGHMGRDTTNPQTDDIFVTVGDIVTAGQVIGRLGDQS